MLNVFESRRPPSPDAASGALRSLNFDPTNTGPP